MYNKKSIIKTISIWFVIIIIFTLSILFVTGTMIPEGIIGIRTEAVVTNKFGTSTGKYQLCMEYRLVEDTYFPTYDIYKTSNKPFDYEIGDTITIVYNRFQPSLFKIIKEE